MARPPSRDRALRRRYHLWKMRRSLIRPLDEPPIRRMVVAGAAIAASMAIGTAGYMIIEGWGFLDALFMTVLTLSTVGYGQVRPLSTAGIAFSIFLIFLGVGAVLYLLNATIQSIFEGQLTEFLGVRKMKAKIEALRDHCIVCGFGRVGQEVAQEFQAQGVPFVVIENEPEAQEKARSLGYLYVDDNATADEALHAAGIGRARCLIAAVGSDAENTYVTLCARAINPDLFIVARAGSPRGEERLRHAGADRVISPYRIGGRAIALSALHPRLTDFADSASGDQWIAEIEVNGGSGLAGGTIHDFLRQRTGITAVLALREPNGRLRVGPPKDTKLRAGQRLIVLGDEKRPSLSMPGNHHPAARESRRLAA